MMLMTKFGHFKMRLIATINISAILTVLNLISASQNYWLRYVDVESNGVPHVAGIWKSCPSTHGVLNSFACHWKNGIISSTHSVWSICVRLLIALGTLGNCVAVICLCVALYFKISKRSKYSIKLMEWANVTLLGSFIGILVGFCVFISAQCNFSMWLHVASICLVACTSNLLTRTFSHLYFMNTRSNNRKPIVIGSGVEAGCCTTEEKIALADKETNTAAATATVTTETEPQMNAIEMNKISEQNGSNEALLPQTTSTAPSGSATASTEATSTPNN